MMKLDLFGFGNVVELLPLPDGVALYVTSSSEKLHVNMTLEELEQYIALLKAARRLAMRLGREDRQRVASSRK